MAMEVVIASNGEAQVRLVPCAPAAGLRHWAIWADRGADPGIDIDAAFSEDRDGDQAGAGIDGR